MNENEEVHFITTNINESDQMPGDFRDTEVSGDYDFKINETLS